MAEFPDDEDIALIREGVALIFHEKYDQARGLFTSAMEKYPEHPMPSFFLAAVYHAEMMDGEHFDLEKEFYENIEATISYADKMRDNDRRSAWAYYFMGGANFYWAHYDGKKGSKWSSARKGLRSKNLLGKCLDRDSTIYDALTCLGACQYFGSAGTSSLNWLPFISDKRQEGIANVLTAIDKSLFSKDMAQSILVWIYRYDEDYEKALALIDRLLERFPEGKLFLWSKSACLREAENWPAAIEVYDTLFQRITGEERQYNNFNLYEISYYRATCYFQLEEYDLAMQAIDYCENLVLSKDVKKRLEEKREDLEKHKKMILEIARLDQ
jgi:tetratricopeptide (TPR) repeat protein